MIWQDAVIAVGQILFAVALVPALRSRQKPPRSTCVMTGVILLVFSVTFATLGLWWGSSTAAVCGVLWLVLLWQQGEKGIPVCKHCGRPIFSHRQWPSIYCPD